MRAYNPAYHIIKALDILEKMEREIIEHGGDDDEYGRKELAKLRRVSDHVWRAAPPDADLGWYRNPNRTEGATTK